MPEKTSLITKADTKADCIAFGIAGAVMLVAAAIGVPLYLRQQEHQHQLDQQRETAFESKPLAERIDSVVDRTATMVCKDAATGQLYYPPLETDSNDVYDVADVTNWAQKPGCSIYLPKSAPQWW